MGVCVEIEDLIEGGLLHRGALGLEGFRIGTFLDAFDYAHGELHLAIALALAVAINLELRQV